MADVKVFGLVKQIEEDATITPLGKVPVLLQKSDGHLESRLSNDKGEYEFNLSGSATPAKLFFPSRHVLASGSGTPSQQQFELLTDAEIDKASIKNNSVPEACYRALHGEAAFPQLDQIADELAEIKTQLIGVNTGIVPLGQISKSAIEQSAKLTDLDAKIADSNHALTNDVAAKLTSGVATFQVKDEHPSNEPEVRRLIGEAEKRWKEAVNKIQAANKSIFDGIVQPSRVVERFHPTMIQIEQQAGLEVIWYDKQLSDLTEENAVRLNQELTTRYKLISKEVSSKIDGVRRALLRQDPIKYQSVTDELLTLFNDLNNLFSPAL